MRTIAARDIMAELVHRHPATASDVEATHRAPWYHAFRLLHVGFIAAPTIAGLDKFFHLLVNWDQYLAEPIARLLPFSAHSFMLIVGVIEIAAGLLVAVKPRIGGLVVGAWLFGIVVNLVIAGTYWDIALRDFGLMLGAFALSRLATENDRLTAHPRPVAPAV
jgi:hypothetical protein